MLKTRSTEDTSANANWSHAALEDIQVDLDEFLKAYNEQRTNQGKYCQGRTPMETFISGLDLYRQYVYDSKEVEQKAA